ncbi:MAG: glucose-6-phosphate isomerase [Gammaproteobacteria bacterium]|nr:glucose-6-phosphate isomerase [Gammaproteobacteria bacterium]
MAGRNDNSPERTAAWRRLAGHRRQAAGLHLRDEFARDPGRAQRFSLGLERVFVDFSKNLITGETLSLLLELADQRGLDKKIGELFSGHEVNPTERRPALHTLLRTPDDRIQDTHELSDVARQVRQERDRMFGFVRKLRAGEVEGATGRPISRVVNIGIGGSDLGPRLLADALSEFHREGIDIDFVANIDPFDIERVLANADPETTLFIIASKSFTTQETLVNANRAKRWLADNGCNDSGPHFLAVSGNAGAVERFGIAGDRYFRIGHWTGGRYSIWSCIGMSAAISIGEDHFSQFLAGAHALDSHFASAGFSANIPVILGLAGIWHNNFLDIGAHAVIPYDQRLERLPAYLGQLVMESNGKSAGAGGGKVGVQTSQVIWGGTGSPAQHAVFQFLHQGTRASSIDFLLPLSSNHDSKQHELLVANCLAQGEALMQGRTDDAEPHRHFDGNRPSTTILYDRLDPYTLGMLLAMYEHKTFVEAAIWGINPFDQWGVELGKTLAGQIAAELAGDEPSGSHDASTEQLMGRYRSAQSS